MDVKYKEKNWIIFFDTVYEVQLLLWVTLSYSWLSCVSPAMLKAYQYTHVF